MKLTESNSRHFSDVTVSSEVLKIHPEFAVDVPSHLPQKHAQDADLTPIEYNRVTPG